jgi:hypothetical protein
MARMRLTSRPAYRISALSGGAEKEGLHAKRQQAILLNMQNIIITHPMQLSENRIQITVWNRQDGKDGFWQFLFDVAVQLGVNGASSDESGAENRKYVIKIIKWRSAKLTPYLQLIDQNMFRSTGLGKNLPGNAPRQRIRLPGATLSRGQAPSGLPLNFYDETWLAGLSEMDWALLEPEHPVKIPSLNQF